MPKLRRLTNEDRADLTAYLDGELGEDRTQQIDSLLAENDIARKEVARLEQTWNLLDTLPRTTASPEFTSRTVASIRVERKPPPAALVKAAEYGRRGLLTLVWIALISAGAAAGYLGGRELVPSRHDDLIQDFELIDRIDLYDDVGDLQFLQTLHDSGTLRNWNANNAASEDGSP
ncbi:anti-sigma factor family protein [Stratiformator vulcanicus]|uniref:Zinc-finger domain-containing protein n=1 Tax=Stratiformator vulcanicus TaxID=2527980 RepID=A0A517R442_9PLAN|nr:hypothetical protein [Stratiformator vulcanicus]QDT38648.1 hypothetical protein Pan189_30430 [Stratiformator vulcanicus]